MYSEGFKETEAVCTDTSLMGRGEARDERYGMRDARCWKGDRQWVSEKEEIRPAKCEMREERE